MRGACISTARLTKLATVSEGLPMHAKQTCTSNAANCAPGSCSPPSILPLATQTGASHHTSATSAYSGYQALCMGLGCGPVCMTVTPTTPVRLSLLRHHKVLCAYLVTCHQAAGLRVEPIGEGTQCAILVQLGLRMHRSPHKSISVQSRHSTTTSCLQPVASLLPVDCITTVPLGAMCMQCRAVSCACPLDVS